MNFTSIIITFFTSVVLLTPAFSQKKLIESLEKQNYTDAITILQEKQIKTINEIIENASFTSFLVKAIDSKNIELLKLMVEKQNADINKAFKTKYTYDTLTPIEYATLIGNNEAFDYLLEKGADYKRTNHQGISVIHRAARNQRVYILKKLLDKGVEIEQRDKNGYTPLMYAAMEKDWVYIGNTEREMLEEQVNVYQRMRKFDGISQDLNYVNDSALIENYVEIIIPATQFLLKKAANINAVSKDNATPLYISLHSSLVFSKYYLLWKGADATIKKSETENCFCESIRFWSPLFVKEVIKQKGITLCKFNILEQVLINIEKCNNEIKEKNDTILNKKHLQTWLKIYSTLLQSKKVKDTYTLEFVHDHLTVKSLAVENSKINLYTLALTAVNTNLDTSDPNIWYFVSKLYSTDTIANNLYYKIYHQIVFSLVNMGVDLNIVPPRGKRTILENATINRDWVLVAELIKLGAKTQRGTILDYSIFEWPSVEAVAYILTNQLVQPSKEEIQKMIEFSNDKIDRFYRKEDFEGIKSLLENHLQHKFK